MNRDWGLRSKVLLASLALIAILIVVLVLLLVYEKTSREGVLDISRQAQTELMSEMARTQTIAVATQLADSVTNDLYYFDLQSIGEQLAFVKQLPAAVDAVVFDASGRVVHDGTRDISGYGTELPARLVQEALSSDGTQATIGEHTAEAARRVRLGDQVLGGVLVRFDLDTLQHSVIESNQRLDQRLQESTRLRLGTLSALLVGLALLCLLASWMIQRRIVQPILKLAAAAREIEAGEYRNFRLDSGRHDEIGELERAFERMSAGISEEHKRTERKAYVDQLTGLPNRRAFDEALATRAEGSEEFALMFLDVDNLKVINDRLGHDAGDHALIDVATRSSEVLDAESGGTAWLARIGGDEFAVLCQGRPIGESAAQLARSVIRRLQSLVSIDESDITASVSIGIALFPAHATKTGDLLKCADMAMYRAKTAGKNRIHVYEPDKR
jgi:diguanylate cyclase (GGDEF)-like protein